MPVGFCSWDHAYPISWYPGAGTGLSLSLLLPGPPPLYLQSPKECAAHSGPGHAGHCVQSEAELAWEGAEGSRARAPLLTVPFSRLFEAGKLAAALKLGLSSFCVCFSGDAFSCHLFGFSANN